VVLTAESPSAGTWLYRPFPAPDFALKDLEGQDHSLSADAGRPAVLLFWSTAAPPSRGALVELAQSARAFAAAGASVLALAVDAPADEARVRAAATGLTLPVLLASEEVAGAYSILNRFLFDRREDLLLPTVLLVSAQGEVVKVYREPIVAARILEDIPRIAAAPGERLARAVPFAGTFYASPGERNEFQYALELSEQGFDAAAVPVFERVAKLDPTAITLYNLGTLYLKRGNPLGARAAFERALEMQPEYAEASNSLGALLAQSGAVPAAIERFRAALQVRPDFPDALNNLGFALFQTGQPAQAFELYEKALALQPGFPEALNNLGIFFGRQGDLDRARSYFQQAVEGRPGYGEAANNLALVLGAQGDAEGAITLLQRTLDDNPAFEMTYVTLSRIYLRAGRRREAVQVLEKLLQRSPNHALGLEILRQAQAGS
jgi:tetratricopeptide (TPR) repeat protein